MKTYLRWESKFYPEVTNPSTNSINFDFAGVYTVSTCAVNVNGKMLLIGGSTPNTPQSRSMYEISKCGFKKMSVELPFSFRLGDLLPRYYTQYHTEYYTKSIFLEIIPVVYWMIPHS